MGRYWNAQTDNGYTFSGKFWFGVQSSDDFINIGFYESSTQSYSYLGCYCNLYTDDPLSEPDWCQNCNNSREEYYQSIEEEY